MQFIELLIQNQVQCLSFAFHVWFLLQLAINTVKRTPGREILRCIVINYVDHGQHLRPAIVSFWSVN